MELTAAIGFVVILIVSWLLTLIGLPGNWLMLTAAVVYSVLLAPDAGRLAIGWPILVSAAVLALVGELLEFAAGAVGATRRGGSRRSALLAIAGSLGGAVIGLFAGIPIPVIGSLVGALLFGGLGALAGAVAGELWKGRDLEQSIEIGKAAFQGRLLGTAAKAGVGAIMLLLLMLALVF